MLTDPDSSTEENLDYVASTPNGRRERWSIYGGTEPVRFYWPLSGELNGFFQIWQIQPASGETIFKISYPGTEGWSFVVPAIGRVPLLLRMPSTDILEISSDPWSTEVEVMYF
jgi:hypothetical protein